MKDKFVGALLGLAVGDALGMPFEGWNSRDIRKKWDRKSFLSRAGLKAGQFTDDTMLAIAQAESIIDKGDIDPEDTAKKLVEWYKKGDTRGVGKVTKEAIEKLLKGISWRESGIGGDMAASNGGAVRVVPLALLYKDDFNKLKEKVKLAVEITHKNIEAIKGAQAIAYAIARASSGTLNPDTFLMEVADYVGNSEIANKLKKAHSYLQEDFPPMDALPLLGTSVYVVESVPSALYCFAFSPDSFLGSVVNAVMAGGDTDTIAALTGAISGAFNGAGAIPENWLNGLERRDYITSLGERLYELWERKKER
ncbi:MAG: ADP-ribosylglycohydrolase family protein [Synergistetes bacterium]|nr:ADP-ribosylglycohydrolase family protein [Synergistota bacterium]MCX8127463.1 ADP-ribosylglycohydrolase family protein [Synergistota bacterium]MDW8192760.1 ADP-ribosylglycohydrolase family protein [Synergistota bacterium]